MMRGMLRELVLLSLLCGGAVFLCPPGGVRRILCLLSTAVFCLAILQPLFALEPEDFAFLAEDLQSAENEILQNGKAGEEMLRRLALQERCERYIEQKAAELGFSRLDAEVELRSGAEGAWMPYAAVIRTDRTAEAKAALQALIARDLGISEERQDWLSYD